MRHNDLEAVDATIHVDANEPTVEREKNDDLSTSLRLMSSMCCGIIDRLLMEVFMLMAMPLPTSTPHARAAPPPRLVHIDTSSTSSPLSLLSPRPEYQRMWQLGL